ncbi:hypothetical protein BaRGS_00003055 [Batillaria attramentaria]|uniref:Uncharacterized protein n=1 Tax=Batillaria attramentaria TaxID=370345 RepID=A0ABD0M1V1_9CAEN
MEHKSTGGLSGFNRDMRINRHGVENGLHQSWGNNTQTPFCFAPIGLISHKHIAKQHYNGNFLGFSTPQTKKTTSLYSRTLQISHRICEGYEPKREKICIKTEICRYANESATRWSHGTKTEPGSISEQTAQIQLSSPAAVTYSWSGLRTRSAVLPGWASGGS